MIIEGKIDDNNLPKMLNLGIEYDFDLVIFMKFYILSDWSFILISTVS